MVNKKNIIREKNLERVKKYLFHHKNALKADISEHIGLSVVTVNSLVNQLLEEEIIFEGELVKQAIGRPALKLHFNYDKYHFLLLSIEEKRTPGKKELVIIGRIVNMAGDILSLKEVSFKQVEKKAFMSIITSLVSLDDTICKIGISFPGKIYEGRVVSSWHHLFNEWHLQDMINKVIEVPVLIENDANLLTIGEVIHRKIKMADTTVGIFYPEKSMPGITIFHAGTILTGNHNLAGEAKFLPKLINSNQEAVNSILIENLIDIIEIYNAVIAPNQFILFADSVNQKHILEQFKKSDIIKKQMNKPKLIFSRDFDTNMVKGLLWLVSQNTFYEL